MTDYVVALSLCWPAVWEPIDTLRFLDKDDYDYEIFSLLRSAHAWTRAILAGKRDSRSPSTTSFSKNVVLVETGYQVLEVLSFCDP